MEHSPEPWIAGWSGDPEQESLDEAGPIDILSFGRGGVARCEPIPTGHACTWDVVHANARRIVACVNACKGIATEELESDGVLISLGLLGFQVPVTLLRYASRTGRPESA